MPVTPNSPVTPQTPQCEGTTLTHSQSANTLVSAYTAGSAGSKIVALNCTNTDTNGYTVQVWILLNGTAYLIGTVSVPASSGNTTSASPINLLAGFSFLPRDNDGQPYILLPAGVSAALQVSATTQVAASMTLYFVAIGSDF